jgi:L-ascorbate metabolism protein UlaG (beta-lactamase superfamily)
MEISWLGHSCFVIKGKEMTIITDPCPPDLGYPLNSPEADIVTISHFHPGHSYIEGIVGNPKQIKGPGEYEVGGVFITGVATFHDAEKGKIRGENTIYTIEMDDITLCHLGDLGHPLTPALVEQIGVIDVLFLPVGGVSTIDVASAIEILRQLNPKIVVPMHYKTPRLEKNLEPVDRFLKEMAIQDFTPKPKLSLSQSSMPSGTQIVILDYPHS